MDAIRTNPPRGELRLQVAAGPSTGFRGGPSAIAAGLAAYSQARTGTRPCDASRPLSVEDPDVLRDAWQVSVSETPVRFVPIAEKGVGSLYGVYQIGEV